MGQENCKSVFIDFYTVNIICCELYAYITSVTSLHMYSVFPVASVGDPDVLGVPFQGHGTCPVVSCLLFTVPVVVCVIQLAPCQPLLLHLLLPLHLPQPHLNLQLLHLPLPLLQPLIIQNLLHLTQAHLLHLSQSLRLLHLSQMMVVWALVRTLLLLARSH